MESHCIAYSPTLTEFPPVAWCSLFSLRFVLISPDQNIIELLINHSSYSLHLFYSIQKIKTSYSQTIKNCSKDGFSGTPGTPVKPNHLEIMGNGSNARSTNGNFPLFILLCCVRLMLMASSNDINCLASSRLALSAWKISWKILCLALTMHASAIGECFISWIW